MEKAKVIMRLYFAMEIQGSARHLSGNKVYLPERKEIELILTRSHDSSLVIDRLWEQVRGQNTAVACFYFDFAAQKEQSATSMLGSFVRQMVSGMEMIPEEISQAFRERKKLIGGCGAQLTDLVKMLQAITSAQRTFMCIDALDECAGVQRVRVLNSLNHIVAKSPCTRIFITGRPQIRGEVERSLTERVICVSIESTKYDIIGYIHARLAEDETPDAMEESLKAEILEKIPENISEMCVGAIVFGIPSYLVC